MTDIISSKQITRPSRSPLAPAKPTNVHTQEKKKNYAWTFALIRHMAVYYLQFLSKIGSGDNKSKVAQGKEAFLLHIVISLV